MTDKKMSRAAGGGAAANNAPGLAVRNTLSSVQFFNALNKYVPSLVLTNWMERQIEKEVLQKQIKQYGRLQNAASSKAADEADDQDEYGTPGGFGRRHTVQPEALKAQIEATQQRLALGDQLPYIQEMETLVLFADISGFTAVSEACSVMGIRGNEELSFVINRYMEGMVKNLSKFGGDIIKFVGDAMIVMWPRKSKPNQGDDDHGDDDEKVLIIRKALQCAMDIQKDMHNKKITANVTSLKVKIGIGWGKCALLYVGGVFNRSEFFTVGIGLERALESEGHASEGGQIIVNESAWKHVKNQYYDGEPTKKDSKFYRVTGCKVGVKGGADAILMKNSMKLDRIAGIQQTLRSCVPAAIMPYLEIGFESYGSETRTLTVMFASLGVEFADASHAEGRNKIQKILTVVQQQVYRMGGSLNKLMMDDKGCTLVCIWGASPMAHVDDAARAVLCALNMRRSLNKVQGTWCNVGIATGEVFSGVVGTSGSRKEFSCLGDTVNLAARIMCVPKKKDIKGGIMCEIRTKNEAVNQIAFNYVEHAEFKGKSVGYSIYEPVDPYEEFPCTYLQDLRTPNKIIPPQCLLKLGYNPLVVQREVNPRKYDDLYEKKIPYVNQIYDIIKNFFFGPNQEPGRSPLSIIVHGEIGSGKTQTVRTLCQKLQSDQELTQAQQLNAISLNKSALMSQAELMKQATSSQVRLPIFAAAPNAETRMQFLGSWRPILRSMFEFRRKQLDYKVADLLRILVKGNYDKVDLLLEIFGFAPAARYVTSADYKQQKVNFVKLRKEVLDGQPDVAQVKEVGASDPNWFVSRERYTDSAVDGALELLAFFVKDFLGEASYESSDSGSESVGLSEASSKRGARNKSPGGPSRQNRTHLGLRDMAKQMCILIFDNAHLLEEESWSLILRLYGSCSNVCIIMAVNQTFKGSPLMPQLEKPPSAAGKRGPGNGADEVPYYCDDQPLEKMFMKDAKIFDTPSLNARALQQTLIELAPAYQESFLEENRRKTEYNGPTEGVPKTPKICRDWMNRLTLDYNLGRVFASVDDKLCNLLVQRCEGNITVCLQYFLELLLAGHIMINERNKVVMKKSLERCILLQNFTKIPVPSSILKRRLRNMDQFLSLRNQKQNQRKKEVFIKGIMVLKAAAVIGEEFGTAALKKILPLREETNGSLAQTLKELEQNDLVETLDETDPKNIHCRFNKSFLRESVYQVLLFKDQKQYLHSQLAEYLQSLPTSVLDPHQADIELLKLREHVMIGEDIKDFKDLPLKQKQGLIVKEMQSKLVRNNQKAILHKDWVFKQGKAANKKISQRFLIMTARELMWFHSVEEYESGATALGVIKIMDIYKCSETLMQQGTYDFDVGFTNYVKKGQVDSMPRVMNFGCKSEIERHEWISRVEFLRAKTVYENYVNKFVNIQFPLKKVDDVEDDSQQKNEAIYEKLNDFGKNFKQNAKVNAAAFQKPAMPTLFTKRATTFQRSRGWDASSLVGRSTQGPAGHRASVRLLEAQPSTAQSAAVVDDTSSEYYSQLQQNNLTAKDVAQKVLQLYRASIIGFHVQTTAHANKTQHQALKNKPIGQLPDYFEMPGAADQLKQSPFFNQESPDQRDRDGPTYSKQHSEGAPGRPALQKTQSEQSPGTQIQTEKKPRRRASLDAGGGSPLDGKPHGMEIVPEQDREGSQGTSTDSRDNRRAKDKFKRERRELTPDAHLPHIGPKNDDLMPDVDSVRRPRKSENLPEQVRQARQSSNEPAPRLDGRNKDQFQGSHGKKSGDSGHQVTAMIEQIEQDRILHPSQSQSNTMNALHQERAEWPRAPGMAPRADRGFTIHDIGQQNDLGLAKGQALALGIPRHKGGKKDSIPSQYDPMLPNGAQQPQMQIDALSSIRDERMSATGAEFGFGADKEMQYEHQGQPLGPSQYAQAAQLQLPLAPQSFASSGGRPLSTGAVSRRQPQQQLPASDLPVQYPPALQEAIDQHVQREVNKSLQRFFTQLNESYVKSGLQSQSARSTGQLPVAAHPGAGPQTPTQGFAGGALRTGQVPSPYNRAGASGSFMQEYLNARHSPFPGSDLPHQSYQQLTVPTPQGQRPAPGTFPNDLRYEAFAREAALDQLGRNGMLKNKVLSERSVLSKQAAEDDDDDVTDPAEDDRVRARSQQPLQGYAQPAINQAQRAPDQRFYDYAPGQYQYLPPQGPPFHLDGAPPNGGHLQLPGGYGEPPAANPGNAGRRKRSQKSPGSKRRGPPDARQQPY